MKRGFEHRLWGYKVVKIKQPDAERGIATISPSSIHSSSPSASLDEDTSEDGNLGPVDSSVSGSPAQDDEQSDQENRKYSNFGNAEPLIRRPVPAPSREGSEEAEERDGVGEWQIPETVILTSESISLF